MKSDIIDGFECFWWLLELLFVIFDFKVYFKIGDFKEDFFFFSYSIYNSFFIGLK